MSPQASNAMCSLSRCRNEIISGASHAPPKFRTANARRIVRHHGTRSSLVMLAAPADTDTGRTTLPESCRKVARHKSWKVAPGENPASSEAVQICRTVAKLLSIICSGSRESAQIRPILAGTGQPIGKTGQNQQD